MPSKISESSRPATIADLQAATKPIWLELRGLKKDVAGLKKDYRSLKSELKETAANIIKAVNDNFVTKDEFNDFRQEVRDTFATKDELKEEFRLLRSDFLGSLDMVMGELKAIREEQAVSALQIRRNSDRIDECFRLVA